MVNHADRVPVRGRPRRPYGVAVVAFAALGGAVALAQPPDPARPTPDEVSTLDESFIIVPEASLGGVPDETRANLTWPQAQIDLPERPYGKDLEEWALAILAPRLVPVDLAQRVRGVRGGYDGYDYLTARYATRGLAIQILACNRDITVVLRPETPGAAHHSTEALISHVGAIWRQHVQSGKRLSEDEQPAVSPEVYERSISARWQYSPGGPTGDDSCAWWAFAAWWTDGHSVAIIARKVQDHPDPHCPPMWFLGAERKRRFPPDIWKPAKPESEAPSPEARLPDDLNGQALALLNADREIRSRALAKLRVVAEGGQAGELVDAIRDALATVEARGHRSGVRHACFLLGRTGLPEARSLLLRLLRGSTAPGHREGGALGLHHFPDEETRAALIEALEDEEDEVVLAAATVLALRDDAPKEELQELLLRLEADQARIMQDTAERVRGDGKPEETAARAARSAAREIEYDIANLMHTLGTRGLLEGLTDVAINALSNAVTDYKRRQAAHALSHYQSQEIADALLETLNGETPNDVRAAVVGALGGQGRFADPEPIKQALALDPAKEVALAAARGLSRLAQETSQPALARPLCGALIKHPEQEVRAICADQLWHFPGEEVEQALLQACTDKYAEPYVDDLDGVRDEAIVFRVRMTADAALGLMEKRVFAETRCYQDEYAFLQGNPYGSEEMAAAMAEWRALPLDVWDHADALAEETSAQLRQVIAALQPHAEIEAPTKEKAFACWAIGQCQKALDDPSADTSLAAARDAFAALDDPLSVVRYLQCEAYALLRLGKIPVTCDLLNLVCELVRERLDEEAAVDELMRIGRRTYHRPVNPWRERHLVAAVACQDLVKHFPDAEETQFAHARLAECLREQVDYERPSLPAFEAAAEAHQSFLDRYPNADPLQAWHIRAALVQLYNRMGKSEDADRIASEAASALPEGTVEWAMAQCMHANRLLGTGKKDEAIKVYRKVLELAPEESGSRTLASKALEQLTRGTPEQ